MICFLLKFLTCLTISVNFLNAAPQNLNAFTTTLFVFNPYDSSQRSIMKRQHLVLAHEIQGRNLENQDDDKTKNIRGGNSQFEYIPVKNQREVRIFDLSNLKGEKRDEVMKNLTKTINEKIPIYEDKAKIQELELALLEKGVWAVCKWQSSLPYPLDKDEQCTQSELKFLLKR